MIPIARPWLGEEEIAAVRRPLESGWVTQGPEVAAFEAEFAAFVGADHACAVSSGTTALHAALIALGVEAGDEVITVSHSFIATANAISFVRGCPVFVDIEPATYNISPDQVREALSDKTRAILCVHQMGMPCNLEALATIAEQAGVALLEDAACAIGSETRVGDAWRRIGSPVGALACFSFHPRKLLTTGDGGMLTTNDPALDARFRSLRHHGIGASDSAKPGAKDPLGPSYLEVGFNFRMTDIQAAIGRAQLKRIPEMIQRRRAQADLYHELIGSILPEMLPTEPEWARSNWQCYTVRLPEGVDQSHVIMAMKDRGITVHPGIMNAHEEPAYEEVGWRCVATRESCGCDTGHCERLAESERARRRCVHLPIFHQLTESEQRKIVEALRGALIHDHDGA